MNATAPDRKGMVHVVDDDESLRTAVSRLLRAAGYEVQAYASAGEFALTRGERLTGCLLLVVRLPGPSGLDLQESLSRGNDSLPIIFLTGHGDIPMSVRAMKAGAVDFLTKPVQRDELLAAIESALAREARIRVEHLSRCTAREHFESLTLREREVFERVTIGQPNKLIADELGVAERTVKAHRAQVMTKMRATSLAELVLVSQQIHRTTG